MTAPRRVACPMLLCSSAVTGCSHVRLPCYVASLRPHRGVGPSLLPLLSAPRAAVVRLSYYAARLRPLATPACPSFIAAQLSSHASCSRALILTDGTPAIALRCHSSFSMLPRNSAPTGCSLAPYVVLKVSRLRPHCGVSSPFTARGLALTGCSRALSLLCVARSRPYRPPACPFTVAQPRLSQAAALRSFYIRHACDRTAASVLLFIAAQLIPRGLRPCALTKLIARP